MRRARHRSCAGTLAMLGALALPGAAQAGTQPTGSVRLSDERAFGYWAHPEHEAPIRRLPSRGSGRVARIHYLTEDGFPEVYPALRRFTDRGGRTWVRIRIPMRPNGSTGWVQRSALGPLYRVRTRLVVSRRRLRATVHRSNRPIWRSRIGIGKRSTPTPAGRFWIRERIKVPRPGGIYGPWAFGTSAYSSLSDWPGGGVIGIHGTNQPYLIPGRPSHGCIRVPNRRLRRLVRLLPIGTPVRIR